MTRLWRGLACFATVLAFVGCGATQPSRPVTITLLPGSPQPTTSTLPTGTSQAPLGEATAEIELTIIGGPADGSYRAVVHGTPCIQPSAGQLVANYADGTAADGFSALNLDVRDAAGAIADETDDFGLNLSVDGASYLVDPKAGQGEGIVLMEIDPLANATLDLFATTADGTEIELSLLCDVEAL